jgi:hypothetical protein
MDADSHQVEFALGIAAKKAKQDAPADSNKYGWPDGWPDQDYYIWNGQRIKRDWTRWKGK